MRQWKGRQIRFDTRNNTGKSKQNGDSTIDGESTTPHVMLFQLPKSSSTTTEPVSQSPQNNDETSHPEPTAPPVSQPLQTNDETSHVEPTAHQRTLYPSQGTLPSMNQPVSHSFQNSGEHDQPGSATPYHSPYPIQSAGSTTFQPVSPPQQTARPPNFQQASYPEQSADNSSYPEPSTPYRTPYPLQGADTTATPTSYPSQDGASSSAASSNRYYPVWPGKPPSWQSSGSTSTNQFMSLSDYFNLGSSVARSQRNQDVEDEVDSGDEMDTAEDSLRLPDGDQTSFNLPGYHFLPERDRIMSGSSSNQQAVSKTSNAARDTTTGARGSRGKRSRGSGRSRSLKAMLKGTSHEDVFSKPKQTRKKTGGKRGRPRERDMGEGARRVDPGPEFSKYQAQATDAYLNGNYEEAMDNAVRAVEVNPEVYTAHYIIVRILEAQEQWRDAFEVNASAAVTKRDFNLWTKLGHDILNFQGENRRSDDVERALFFYSKAISTNQWAYEARCAKAKLLEQIGDDGKARQEYKNITKKWPSDIGQVMHYAELCNQSLDPFEWEKATLAYKNAFAQYANQETFGDPEQQWTHLNIYLDLLERLRRWKDGACELKRLSRWFLGRKEDVFWDGWTDDDREYDLNHDPRRFFVWQFQQGRISRDLDQYGKGLPIEMRVKLGQFRLNLGHDEEAFKHFECLLESNDDLGDYVDLFFDVGELLKSREMYGRALRFFEPIKSLPASARNPFRIAIGKCYVKLGRNEDAEPFLKAVLDEDIADLEARALLGKVYENMGQTEKAHAITAQLEKVGRYDLVRKHSLATSTPPTQSAGALPNGGGSFGAENQQVATPTAYRPILPNVEDIRKKQEQIAKTGQEEAIFAAQGQRVNAHYSALNDLWPALEARENAEDVRKWMESAKAMAKEFKKVKNFFDIPSKAKASTSISTGLDPKSRMMVKEIEAINKRTRGAESSSFGAFHDIPFSEWHRIMSQLALLYVEVVDQQSCNEILQEYLLKATVFRKDAGLHNASLAVCLYCATVFNDTQLLNDVARRYVERGQPRSDNASQLLAATGRIGYGEMFFNDRYTKGQVLNWIKEKDYLAMTPAMRTQYPWGTDAERLKKMAEKAQSSDNNLDPGLLTMYGHMANSHRHGNSNPALPYLFRALALQPENTIINLSIATAFVVNAMERAPDNRQYDISQGLAFLERYRELRVASGKACHMQEAEYNVARTWHQLGLTHAAVPGYQKVLALSEKVQKEYAEEGGDPEIATEDFAMEAALAMKNIFSLAGNHEAARAITEKWLVM